MQPFKFLVSVLIAVSISAPAFASGPMQPFRLGAWNGGAFFFDNTGKFSHCAANYSAGGVSLSVNVNNDHLWGLVIGNSSWKPAPGTALPVDITFDGTKTLHLYAKAAANPNFVIVLMPETATAMSVFRESHHMTAFGGGAAYEFELDQSSQLLTNLRECARTNMNATAAPVAAAPQAAGGQGIVNSDAAVERAKLLGEAVKEQGACLTTQMRQIVPYSNESADTLAQVVITKCAAAEEKFVQLGIAIFNVSRVNMEKIVSDALDKRKKQLVADIVTFRADRARSLLAPQQKDGGTQAPTGGGI